MRQHASCQTNKSVCERVWLFNDFIVYSVWAIKPPRIYVLAAARFPCSSIDIYFNLLDLLFSVPLVCLNDKTERYNKLCVLFEYCKHFAMTKTGLVQKCGLVFYDSWLASCC